MPAAAKCCLWLHLWQGAWTALPVALLPVMTLQSFAYCLLGNICFSNLTSACSDDASWEDNSSPICNQLLPSCFAWMSQAEAAVEADVTAAPAPIWHGVTAGAASALASRIFTREPLPPPCRLAVSCMHPSVKVRPPSRPCADPADTVKARLQMQGAIGGGKPVYLSTVSAFKTVCAKPGWKVPSAAQSHQTP